MAVLQERDYVEMDRKRLVPVDKGRLVTAFLSNFFERYVEYDFTAGLEEKLDLISDGKLDWQQVCESSGETSRPQSMIPRNCVSRTSSKP